MRICVAASVGLLGMIVACDRPPTEVTRRAPDVVSTIGYNAGGNKGEATKLRAAADTLDSMMSNPAGKFTGVFYIVSGPNADAVAVTGKEAVALMRRLADRIEVGTRRGGATVQDWYFNPADGYNYYYNAYMQCIPDPQTPGLRHLWGGAQASTDNNMAMMYLNGTVEAMYSPFPPVADYYSGMGGRAVTGRLSNPINLSGNTFATRNTATITVATVMYRDLKAVSSGTC